MKYKIREAQQSDRVPYMLILGAKEAEEGTVSVRKRDQVQNDTMTAEEFIDKILEEIRTKAH